MVDEGSTSGRKRRNRAPDRFTRARRDSYLALIRQGVRPMAAARAIGVSRNRVMYYRKNDPVFAQEFEEAQEEALESIEDAAFQLALAGNATLIQFILTNRAPTRWKKEPVAMVPVASVTNVQVNVGEMGLAELRSATLALIDESEEEHLALTNPRSGLIEVTSTEVDE